MQVQFSSGLEIIQLMLENLPSLFFFTCQAPLILIRIRFWFFFFFLGWIESPVCQFRNSTNAEAKGILRRHLSRWCLQYSACSHLTWVLPQYAVYLPWALPPVNFHQINLDYFISWVSGFACEQLITSSGVFYSQKARCRWATAYLPCLINFSVMFLASEYFVASLTQREMFAA